MFSIEYRYFYQAGVDKSVRKAANSLNINSSAVVRQIHKLEDNLNMKFFDRSSKGLSLTNEGKVVFKYVSEQLEKNENFLNDIQSAKGKITGVINISTGKPILMIKVDNKNISRPFVSDKKLFIIKDNAIIKLD